MSYYDFPSAPSLEELEKAASSIKRERLEQNYGWGFYDYIPEPTIREAWKYVENQKWPDR